MQTWRRRIRGAIGLGLLWAAAGAGVGALIELIDNVLPAAHPLTRLVDMWPQTLAIPGFLGGVVFATVLGIAAGRRRFDELSLPRITAWGAVAGLLLGGLAMALGAPAVFLGIMTLGSAIAAAGSLALARRADDRRSLDAGVDVPGVGPAEGEGRRLPGRRS